MGRRRKETFASMWIVGVAIVAVILYATMTILFWLAVMAVGGALLYLTYLLTTKVEWFENRITPTILTYSATVLIIIF